MKNRKDEDENIPSNNAGSNEYDLNDDDLKALGSDELNMDGGDDDLLRDEDYDFTGEDLDVPGSELDDDMEGLGSEDEENNSYSIGGDNHNDLEEDANRI